MLLTQQIKEIENKIGNNEAEVKIMMEKVADKRRENLILRRTLKQMVKYEEMFNKKGEEFNNEITDEIVDTNEENSFSV